MLRNPTTDLIVVLLIVLLIFGPKRLPGLGKQLGSGIREFKDSITGNSREDDEEERPAITSATPAAPTTTASTASTATPSEAQPSTEVGSERRS